MIENYFRPGIRLKWQAPGDVRPPVGELVDPYLRHINVSTLGLGQPKHTPIQYNWLDYNLGRTSRCHMQGRDVLTGFMSGCIIAKWRSPAGAHYVGHVGTIDGNKAVNRTVKKKFAFSMPRNTQGFNPADTWGVGEILQQTRQFKRHPAVKIMALVTTNGDFYSILMLNLQGNEWCVGGSKKVQPMHHDRLKLTLMRYD